MLAFSVVTNGDLGRFDGALSCRDGHGLVSRQEPFRFAPANKNDYPEIRCLNRGGTLDNEENYLIRKLFTLGPGDDLYIQPGAENSSTSQRFLTVSDDKDSSQVVLRQASASSSPDQNPR